MGGFLSAVCSNKASPDQRRLVVGDALQVGEYVLNLHKALLEGGHGKH